MTVSTNRKPAGTTRNCGPVEYEDKAKAAAATIMLTVIPPITSAPATMATVATGLSGEA